MVLYNRLYNLNFPNFNFIFKKYKNKLYVLDIIRKSYVLCTPEEWVRQNLIHYMIKEKKCNIYMIQIEKEILVSQNRRKVDIIIYYNSNNKIWLIAECKNFLKKIDEFVFYQIRLYNKKCKAKYILVTNGINHFCYKADCNFIKYNFVNEIPFYQQ